MKKALSLFAAMLALSGLKAQTTPVKKETTAPKPADTVSVPLTKPDALKGTKDYKAPGYKWDNNKPASPAQFKKENATTIKKSGTQTFKAG